VPFAGLFYLKGAAKNRYCGSTCARRYIPAGGNAPTAAWKREQGRHMIADQPGAGVP
jgi:hypothetical protein